MHLTLLILFFALLCTCQNVKTFQLEFIEIEMDQSTRKPVEITLTCLIEEDSMSFPIHITDLELLVMRESSGYLSNSLATYSDNYFGHIGFKLGGPLPRLVLDDVTDERLGEDLGPVDAELSGDLTTPVHLDRPFILDMLYYDERIVYTGQIIVPNESLRNVGYSFGKTFGSSLRYTLTERTPGQAI